MLCDTIINSQKMLDAYDNFAPTRDKVAAAQKFMLGPDFAMAADGLVDNYTELKRITPFCRLPYPLTWIEFSQHDRPYFSTAKIYHPEFQSVPSRIGFLLEARDKSMARWSAYLMWTFNVMPAWVKIAESASMMRIDYDVTKLVDELGDICSIEMAGYGLNLLEDLLHSGALKDFAEVARSDWAGEIRYLIAVLGLLNARNVAEHQYIDKSAHNRKRIKVRKAPLSSHTLLKIRAPHRPVITRMPTQEDRAEVRAHFVRGHFKARRTGLFFWGPHMRGRLQAGYVSKDYEVHHDA